MLLSAFPPFMWLHGGKTGERNLYITHGEKQCHRVAQPYFSGCIKKGKFLRFTYVSTLFFSFNI